MQARDSEAPYRGGWGQGWPMGAVYSEAPLGSSRVTSGQTAPSEPQSPVWATGPGARNP